MSTIGTLPDQRVSETEKKNSDWYIPTIDYIINKAIGMNYESKLEVASNLAAAEGVLKEDSYNYVTKAFGITDKDINLPIVVRDVSLILPIKRRYMGEYIRQYKNFQVYHKGIDAVKQRNSELSIQLEQLIAQKMINVMNENNLPSGGNSNPIPNIDEFIKNFEETWIDDKVIESQKILNLVDELTSNELNYIKAFYYYWATDEVYSYRRVIGENIHKEIVNPVEYYRIPSGNQFVEDDDMGMRQYMLSFNQLNEQFEDKLSESDKTYLRSMQNFSKTSNYHSTILDSRFLEFMKSREEYNYISNLPDFATANLSSFDLARFNWVYHIVFKAESKLGTLDYIDTFGTVQQKIVDETYKLNKEAGDISIDWKWYSRMYQAWRIGDQYTGIYIKPELVEPQRQELNMLSKCKSPYNGITGTFDANIRNSICKVLKPYEALYRIYQYQRERAVAKFRATLTVIPESLITDSKELTREQKLKFAKRDDILWVNDDDVSQNTMNLLKTFNLSGSAEYIDVLDKLIDSIKREALEVADMSPQRYGDINQSAGKGTTQMAINNAQVASILLFTLFNKFVETDKEADVDYAKVAWIGGKQGSFLDKKTNKIVYVDVDGEDFFNRNIGVFIGNTAINDEKLQQFRQLAFSAAQNQDFDIAADSIELENSTEIHRLIKEAMEKKREFEREMNERTAQAQENASKNELQNNQEQRAADKYKVDTTNQKDIEVAKIQAGASITTQNIKTAENIDNKIKEHEIKKDELLNQK